MKYTLEFCNFYAFPHSICPAVLAQQISKQINKASRHIFLSVCLHLLLVCHTEPIKLSKQLIVCIRVLFIALFIMCFTLTAIDNIDCFSECCCGMVCHVLDYSHSHSHSPSAIYPSSLFIFVATSNKQSVANNCLSLYLEQTFVIATADSECSVGWGSWWNLTLPRLPPACLKQLM